METTIDKTESNESDKLFDRVHREVLSCGHVDLYLLLIYDPVAHSEFDHAMHAMSSGLVEASAKRIQVFSAATPRIMRQRFMQDESKLESGVSSLDLSFVERKARILPFSCLSSMFGGRGNGDPLLVVSNTDRFDRYQSCILPSVWSFAKEFARLAADPCGNKSRFSDGKCILSYGSFGMLTPFRIKLLNNLLDPSRQFNHTVGSSVELLDTNGKSETHRVSDEDRVLNLLCFASNTILSSDVNRIIADLKQHNETGSFLSVVEPYLPFLEDVAFTSVLSGLIGLKNIRNSFGGDSGEFDGSLLSLVKSLEREWNASFVHEKRRELQIDIVKYYFLRQPDSPKKETTCDGVDFNKASKNGGSLLAWDPPSFGKSLSALKKFPPPHLSSANNNIFATLEGLCEIRNEAAHSSIDGAKAVSSLSTIEQSFTNGCLDALLIEKKETKTNAYSGIQNADWCRLNAANPKLVQAIRS